MWTRPNYLEFEIIRPSWFNKAHITISFKYFNQRTEMAGYATLGYSFPPRPHDAEGSKIVLSPPSRNLPLRKYGKKQHSILFYYFLSAFIEVYLKRKFSVKKAKGQPDHQLNLLLFYQFRTYKCYVDCAQKKVCLTRRLTNNTVTHAILRSGTPFKVWWGF